MKKKRKEEEKSNQRIPISSRHLKSSLDSILINRQEEWEVEKIINSCWHYKKFQYLIKWKNFCYNLKLRVKSKRRILYRDYTRELSGVPSTKCLPYIHLANGPCYTKPNLP